MLFKQVKRFAAAAVVGVPLLAGAASQTVEVFKTATCGCCKAWVKHMRDAGFTVNAHDVENPTQARGITGIPERLAGCHTAVVGGYAIDGHVPAADVRRLLKEKPAARGLAVAGMPAGSPGMEADVHVPYDVLLVGQDGKTTVYAHHD